tara:strand:- start:13 stop:123 length:111 start_codon:yes stop_codon:yes gene_type:complete
MHTQKPDEPMNNVKMLAMNDGRKTIQSATSAAIANM